MTELMIIECVSSVGIVAIALFLWRLYRDENVYPHYQYHRVDLWCALCTVSIFWLVLAIHLAKNFLQR